MECLEWCETEMDVNKYYMVEVANICFVVHMELGCCCLLVLSNYCKL